MTKPKFQSSVLRILCRLQLLAEFLAYSLGVLYRRRFHSGRLSPRDWPQPLHLTPSALLRECLLDLRTALIRMGRRFDVLPFHWSFLMGPCFERETDGTLRLNRRSLANTRDIENFQRGNPTATLFDVEAFHLGWEAGAKWAEGSSCRQGQADIPCDSPSREIISDLPHHGIKRPSRPPQTKRTHLFP